MDAATHGLVDDARELRDKALFAPIQSQYKIYIIDEAHQLGPAAANALLKIVEEPPPYVIFIFATTEPEKVIPTIRSRTHHYQFRLVGPDVLRSHLAEVSRKEGVFLEDGALTLAVQAGNGSVRDSLSALGQLLNGAVDGKVGYKAALQLLGRTSNELLAQVDSAIERQDSAAILEIVNNLIAVGHDLRRFSLDLLDHFRDLMVIGATGGEKSRLLRSYSDQDLEQLQRLAELAPISRLVSLTEIVADHVVRLRTAISPQITLETMMLRLLQAEQPSERAAKEALPTQPSKSNRILSPIEKSAPSKKVTPAVKTPQTKTTLRIALTDLRVLVNNWPRILEEIKNRRRLTWTLLSSQSQPIALDSGMVTISLPSSGALDSFERSNSGDVLLASMKEFFEGDFTIQMVVKGVSQSGGSRVNVVDLADSSDQLTGEELLMKELGAKVILREDQ
jgi:DNA polymerase-3 subunit gamma/tau